MDLKSDNLKYILFIVAVAALALAGYAGYELYPRFDLPAATGMGLLVLAAMAGTASFFSPCSFPLLVTLLARESKTEEGVATFRNALLFAAALSAGAATFLLLTGLGIAAGAGAFFEQVTFTSFAGRALRVVIGALLILLGLAQSGRLPLSFHGVEKISEPLQKAQARLRRVHPLAGMVLFGFAYILAGFG